VGHRASRVSTSVNRGNNYMPSTSQQKKSLNFQRAAVVYWSFAQML
jgi:hypothetical protein